MRDRDMQNVYMMMMIGQMVMQTRCDNGDVIDAICARARACVSDFKLRASIKFWT